MTPGRQQPSVEDPVARALTEGIGGPVGEHARPARWFTPLRVVVLLAGLCFALGMLQKAPCAADDWTDGHQRYVAQCYSDVPYLYTGRGFSELLWPYSGDDEVRAKYEVMEYPVGIAYVAWATAEVGNMLTGDDADVRASIPGSELFAHPEVIDDQRMFVAGTAVLLGLAALLAAYLLGRVNRDRPWDAVLFAASPVLAVNALVNWDLLAVVPVAAALLAWSRNRVVLTGVMIGLGTAIKLYPLLLLGGVIVLCLRARRWGALVACSLAAGLTWLLVNAPAMLTGWAQWKHFWTFNDERGADLGSIWLVLAQAGHGLDTETINRFSVVFLGIWCIGVLALGLVAKHPARLAQLGFLVVVGLLLVNKVYSPQYVLWLLPLAVLARPRWRDQIIWQSCELFYFAMVWLYLDGQLAPGSGDGAGFYWLAILVRMAGELYLVGIVARDVLAARHDPVAHERIPAYDERAAVEEPALS